MSNSRHTVWAQIMMETNEAFADASFAAKVLGVVAVVYAETHRDATDPNAVKFDSQFERDLGFDSLARADLFGRIEQALHVRVPLEDFATVLTPADLVHAIEREIISAASGATAPETQPVCGPASLSSDTPTDATTLIEVLLWHVDRHPQRTHIVFVEDGVTPAELSYGDLHRRAAAAASDLRNRGIGPGSSRPAAFSKHPAASFGMPPRSRSSKAAPYLHKLGPRGGNSLASWPALSCRSRDGLHAGSRTRCMASIAGR